MKVFITCFSLLYITLTVQATLFGNWKSGGDEEPKHDDTKAQPGNRKVVLVPRMVYVPVYTSGDDPAPLGPRKSLTPISWMASVPVGPPQQDQQQSQRGYLSPPPPEVYAMYSPGFAARFPYGAVGPQLQYASPYENMGQMMPYNFGPEMALPASYDTAAPEGPAVPVAAYLSPPSDGADTYAPAPPAEPAADVQDESNPPAGSLSTDGTDDSTVTK